MKQIKIEDTESIYKIKACDNLIDRFCIKLADATISLKSQLEDSKLAMDEAFFRWGLHYNKPVEQGKERCPEEIAETNKILLETKRIIREIHRVDEESNFSKMIKKYDNIRRELIYGLCEKLKALPEHLDLNKGVANVPDDFNYDKIMADLNSH